MDVSMGRKSQVPTANLAAAQEGRYVSRYESGRQPITLESQDGGNVAGGHPAGCLQGRARLSEPVGSSPTLSADFGAGRSLHGPAAYHPARPIPGIGG